MPTETTAAPRNWYRRVHDRFLADLKVRARAKELDPGAWGLLATQARRDNALWAAHLEQRT